MGTRSWWHIAPFHSPELEIRSYFIKCLKHLDTIGLQIINYCIYYLKVWNSFYLFFLLNNFKIYNFLSNFNYIRYSFLLSTLKRDPSMSFHLLLSILNLLLSNKQISYLRFLQINHLICTAIRWVNVLYHSTVNTSSKPSISANWILKHPGPWGLRLHP